MTGIKYGWTPNQAMNRSSVSVMNVKQMRELVEDGITLAWLANEATRITMNHWILTDLNWQPIVENADDLNFPDMYYCTDTDNRLSQSR